MKLVLYFVKMIYINSIYSKLFQDVSKNTISKAFVNKISLEPRRRTNRSIFEVFLYKNGTRERQFSNCSVESVKPVSAQKEVIAWHAFAGSFQNVDTQANRLLDSLTFYENRA